MIAEFFKTATEIVQGQAFSLCLVVALFLWARKDLNDCWTKHMRSDASKLALVGFLKEALAIAEISSGGKRSRAALEELAEKVSKFEIEEEKALRAELKTRTAGREIKLP